MRDIQGISLEVMSVLSDTIQDYVGSINVESIDISQCISSNAFQGGLDMALLRAGLKLTEESNNIGNTILRRYIAETSSEPALVVYMVCTLMANNMFDHNGHLRKISTLPRGMNYRPFIVEYIESLDVISDVSCAAINCIARMFACFGDVDGLKMTVDKGCNPHKTCMYDQYSISASGVEVHTAEVSLDVYAIWDKFNDDACPV